MTVIRRVSVTVLSLVSFAALRVATAVAQQPPPTDFKPLDQLPPAEQIAAAPLLVAAYAVVLVVLFLYLLSVARRLNVVQREVDRLEADVKRAGRA